MKTTMRTILSQKRKTVTKVLRTTSEMLRKTVVSFVIQKLLHEIRILRKQLIHLASLIMEFVKAQTGKTVFN